MTPVETSPVSRVDHPLLGDLTVVRPLDAVDFRTLTHAGSLKGLLRPFKGKGELQAWSDSCARLRAALIDLAQRRVLAPATAHPFSALPVRLSRQTSRAGTVLLRWRNVDRSAMGTGAWAALVADRRTPAALISDLYGLELQRIALNMQISLVHTIARHAHICAAQAAHAETLILSRPRAPATSKLETP